MAQYELNLRDYWYIAKKRRVIIVASTLLVAVAVFLFTHLLKPAPIYEAAASVKYDRALTLAGLYVDMITYSPADEIATQMVVIKSFPVMESVARKLGLIVSGASRPSSPTPAQEPDRTAAATPAHRPGPKEERPSGPASHVTTIKTERLGEVMKVMIHGDGVFTPDTFDVGRKMVVVDLPGTTYLGASKVIPVNEGVLKRVRIDPTPVKEQKMVRVVLDLTEETQYAVAPEGEAVAITLRLPPSLASKGPITPDEKPAAPTAPMQGSELAAGDLKKIFALQERIRTERSGARLEGTTNVIKISAKGSDPKETAKLANTVAESFHEYNIEIRNRQIITAQKFIASQVNAVGERLRKAEQEVKAFKDQEQRVFLTDEAKTLLTTLTNLETEHGRIMRTIEEAEDQLAQLKSGAIRVDRPTAGTLGEDSSGPILTLNTTMLNLLSERDALLIIYTPEHPQVREMDQKIRNLQSEIRRTLTAKLKTYQAREAALAEQIARHERDYRKVPETSLKLARLDREVKVNEDLYSFLKSKQEEASIKAVERIEEVTLISPAFPPEHPLNVPKTGMNVAVGGLMGLLLGVVAAFTRESLDTSLGTIEETENFLGIPVLGIIPMAEIEDLKVPVDRERRRAKRRDADAPSDYSGPERRRGLRRFSEKPEILRRFVMLVAPQSTLAEAYRSLRTNITFAMAARESKILAFTSASLREGKTTTSINLSITMAQAGKRTLLVDCDLRDPAIAHSFGLDREPGLSEILLGNHPWQETVRTVADFMAGTLGVEEAISSPGMDKVSIITSGSPPPNVAEFMGSQKMAALLEELKSQYDLIILDTPPILPVADTLILAPRTDGMILVYQVGQIPRMALKRSKDLLEKVQAKVLGVVLNNVRAEVSLDYLPYKYAYTYGRYGAAAKEAESVKTSLWGFLGHFFK